ncbi:MAG: hypothetical protein SFX73_36555 [Kofleriaceae bacterium]|nr:hypothetical protein [Kofleriaceae bacterium]
MTLVFAVFLPRPRRLAAMRRRQPVQQLARRALLDEPPCLVNACSTECAATFETHGGHPAIRFERVLIARPELPELRGPVPVERAAQTVRERPLDDERLEAVLASEIFGPHQRFDRRFTE